MFIGALIAVTLALPTKPELDLNTLEYVCMDLTKGVDYTITIDDKLRYRPVVYRILKRDNPLKQLKGLCQTLWLNCEIDTQKKTIDITRNNNTRVYDRQARIQRTLDEMFRVLGPTSNWQPRDIYDESKRQRELASQSDLDEESRQRHAWACDLLETAFRSGEMMVLTSLMANRPTAARTLASFCTVKNRISLSPTTKPLIDQYFAGKGIDFIDAKHQEDFATDAWDAMLASDQSVRELIKEYGHSNPVVFLHHSSMGSNLTIAAHMITPSKRGGIGDISVNLLPTLQPIPKQNGKLAFLDSPVKRLTPFRTGAAGLSMTDPIVPTLDTNFASWLAYQPYENAPTFRNVVDKNPVRINVIDDWLQVVDYNDPFPEYSFDWRPFLALRPYVEEDPKSPTEWLKKLQPLTQEEMNDLEAIEWAYFQCLRKEYSGMTAGVRLLRAVLRQCADTKVESFELPVEQLVDPARDDLVAFIQGNYVWSSYICLLHPQNRTRIGKAVLVAKVDRSGTQPMLAYSLKFPPEAFQFDQAPVFEFKVPISLGAK